MGTKGDLVYVRWARTALEKVTFGRRPEGEQVRAKKDVWGEHATQRGQRVKESGQRAQRNYSRHLQKAGPLVPASDSGLVGLGGTQIPPFSCFLRKSNTGGPGTTFGENLVLRFPHGLGPRLFSMNLLYAFIKPRRLSGLIPTHAT